MRLRRGTERLVAEYGAAVGDDEVRRVVGRAFAELLEEAAIPDYLPALSLRLARSRLGTMVRARGALV
jgi:hypothetical protein